MKVVIVAEQLRRSVAGGIGTYGRGLLQGLGAMGGAAPEVSLYASRAPAQPDPLSSFGYPVDASRLPGPVLTRMWDRRRRRAPRGADVVHALSLAFPPSPAAPLSVMVHDLSFREVPETFPPRGRRWHEHALGRALTEARVLMTPSPATADALVRAGAKPDRVEVIAEGSDHLPPADDAGAGELLARLGVDGPFVLSVGTLEPRKNLTRLLEAHDRAAVGMPLVVVGPQGWGQAPSSALAAGHVPDAVLAGLYRRTRCLVYVPLVEGFGLPPVEAMREGTPVVASPMPSIGDAALIVDPTDVEAIAGAIGRAATDETVRSQLVEAGRQRAGELTWEAAARRHVEVWEAMA